MKSAMADHIGFIWNHDLAWSYVKPVPQIMPDWPIPSRYSDEHQSHGHRVVSAKLHEPRTASSELRLPDGTVISVVSRHKIPSE
jgi:hypothetical protein